MLPVGLSDTPGEETVKLFCPSCLDVYTPPNSRFQTVDGAFFGTTFGCLFFMTFPDFEIATPNPRDSVLAITAARSSESSSATPPTINGVPPSNLAPGLGRGNIYEPRIYGFRVSERARSGPRMKWLRSKPDDVSELDEERRFEELRIQEENGDEDDEIDEDEKMVDAEGAPLTHNRKMAPARRRRQANGGTSPMDTNGIGDGG